MWFCQVTNMNTTEEDLYVSKEIHLKLLAELSKEIETLKERYQSKLRESRFSLFIINAQTETFLNVVLSADGQEADLQNKLQAKDDTINDLEHKVSALIREHADERERLLSEAESLQRQLSEKNSCVREFESQLRQVHEALTSVEERMKSLEQERAELHHNAESMQRELTEKTARVQALSDVESRQCDVIDELQQQLQELRSESEQRGEEIAKLNKTIEALKHDKQLLQETISTLQLAANVTASTRDHPVTASTRDNSRGDKPTITSTREQVNEAPITGPKRSNPRTLDAVTSGPVVCFSGFKKDNKYNDTLKQSLTQFVVHVMKGQVHDTAEFSHNITHVVTPPHTRTLKTLAAVLTCKWLVTPEWLIDAKRAHDTDPAAALLGPEKYGIRLQAPPFKEKTFAFHSSFSAGAEGASNLKNAEILLKVGKGKRVKESEATVVLVGDELEGQKSSYYSWNQFMAMILEHVPPLLKERPKRKVDKVTNPEAPKQKKTKL